MAQNYLRYALGAGVHLMVVNLVAAVGLRALFQTSSVIHSVGQAGAPGLVAVVLYLLGAALLFAYVLRRIPATVSSIVSGAVAPDSGGAMMAAAASGAHMGVSAAMLTVAPAARIGVGAVLGAAGKVGTAVEASTTQRRDGAAARLNNLVNSNAAGSPPSQTFNMPPKPPTEPNR
jgi:hypothetical protein